MDISRHSSLPKRPEFMRTIIYRRGGSPERRERGRMAAPVAGSREARRVVMMMILAGQMPAFSIQRSKFNVQRQSCTRSSGPSLSWAFLFPKRTMTITLNPSLQLNIPRFPRDSDWSPSQVITTKTTPLLVHTASFFCLREDSPRNPYRWIMTAGFGLRGTCSSS